MSMWRRIGAYKIRKRHRNCVIWVFAQTTHIVSKTTGVRRGTQWYCCIWFSTKLVKEFQSPEGHRTLTFLFKANDVGGPTCIQQFVATARAVGTGGFKGRALGAIAPSQRKNEMGKNSKTEERLKQTVKIRE